MIQTSIKKKIKNADFTISMSPSNEFDFDNLLDYLLQIETERTERKILGRGSTTQNEGLCEKKRGKIRKAKETGRDVAKYVCRSLSYDLPLKYL